MDRYTGVEKFASRKSGVDVGMYLVTVCPSISSVINAQTRLSCTLDNDLIYENHIVCDCDTQRRTGCNCQEQYIASIIAGRIVFEDNVQHTNETIALLIVLMINAKYAEESSLRNG